MKLARKIILLVLALFLALLGLLGYVEAERAVRGYDAHVAAELAITGRVLRSSMAEVAGVEGEARALDVLRRADTDLAHVQFRWTSGAGLSPADAASLERGEEVVVERQPSGLDGEERVYVYVPVTSDHAIELSQALAEEPAIIRRVLQDRLAVALAAAIGALWVSVLAGMALVGRPMRALVEQARRIGARDFSGRLAIARRDEIGELAVAMNGMCDQLVLAEKRIAAENEARMNAVEQLRRADRLSTVGTLASGMAHELGTPLSVVAGRAKMIGSGSRSAKEIFDDARAIAGQADRMTRIIRGLLDFARRTPTEKAPADLREIARRTLDLLAPLAAKRQVTLMLEPEGTGPAVADVNVGQVEQAVTNIVVNGIHSMDHGQLQVRTDRVDASPPAAHGGARGEYIRVTVRDRGEGIPPDRLSRIFEPFYTTKDVGEGTGLGLSITWGIMQEHGGWIDVESEPGAGSAFSLYFRPTE